MKRLGVVIGLSLWCLVSFGQAKIYQIEADTINRTFPITSTISEGGNDYKELTYQSIDSLVKQIAIDSLGLDTALWVSDGNKALVQKSDNNNLFIGNGAGSSRTTGTNNILLGANAGSGLTTASNVVSIGAESLMTTTQSGAIGIGYRAGKAHNVDASVFIGQNAGYLNNGATNVFIGENSGLLSTTGTANMFIGSSSFAFNTTGSDNVGVGVNSGQQNTGIRNIFIGSRAGLSNTSNYNVMIGYGSGKNSGASQRNVFIGYEAGENETGSNKLYIESTNSASPLIYGEFNNDLARVNGFLEVRDKTGTAGNFAAFDGDKIIDSGVDSGALLDQDLSTNTDSLLITNGIGVHKDSINYWQRTASDLTYSAGNVGIGVSPSYGLDVATTARFTGLVYDGNGNFGTNGYILTSNAGKLLWEAPSTIIPDEFGAMDFYQAGSTYFFRAEDDLGNGLGDAISFTAGTNISFTNTGNNLTINSTAPTTQWIDLGTSLSSNNHDIIVDDIDFTTRGSNATVLIGQDATGYLTDIPLGTGLTLSSGTLSATGSSEWTDFGTYIATNDGDNVYLPITDNIGFGDTTPEYNIDLGSSSSTIHIGGDLYDKNTSNGNVGDLLTSDGDQVEWKAPSTIGENDLDNDMPIGQGSKATSTTISTSGTTLTMTSETIDNTGTWSITSSINLEVPEAGIYLITVNYITQNSNCQDISTELRSDGTTLKLWVDGDYPLSVSKSTIKSLTSTSSLNVIVESSVSGCSVLDFELSAAKLAD